MMRTIILRIGFSMLITLLVALFASLVFTIWTPQTMMWVLVDVAALIINPVFIWSMLAFVLFLFAVHFSPAFTSIVPGGPVQEEDPSVRWKRVRAGVLLAIIAAALWYLGINMVKIIQETGASYYINVVHDYKECPQKILEMMMSMQTMRTPEGKADKKAVCDAWNANRDGMTKVGGVCNEFLAKINAGPNQAVIPYNKEQMKADFKNLAKELDSLCR